MSTGTNPTGDDTTPNEYTAIVDEVWAGREARLAAKTALQEAQKANREKFDAESELVAAARRWLNDAGLELSRRDSENYETRNKADEAARKAYADAVGEEYSRF